MKKFNKILVLLILFMVAPLIVCATEVNDSDVNTDDVTEEINVSAEEELAAPTFVSKTGNGSVRLIITNFVDGVNYEVYRSTNKNVGYVSVGITYTEEFVDPSVNVGDTYYYRIQAIKGAEFVNSAPVVVKVGLLTPSVKVVSTDKTTLTVTWTAIDGADGYEVYRATSKTGKYTKVATTKDAIFVNTKLTTGKGYYYKVRAYKKFTKVGYSALSNIVGAIPKVGITTLNGVSADYNKVKLAWNKVSGANGYTVYKLVGSKYKAIKNTTSLTYTDSKLTTGTKYTYVVRAYSLKSGKKYYGNNSNVIKVAPVPKNPNVTINNKLSRYSLTISTTKVAGATGYYFYKYNNGEYELLAKTKKLSVIDKNVQLGNEYTYKVVAYSTVKGKEYLSKETVKTEIVRPAQSTVKITRYSYENYKITNIIPEFEDTDNINVKAYVKVSDGEYELIIDQPYTEEAGRQKLDMYMQSNFVLGNTYSVKFLYSVNGIESVESNVLTFKPYLDTPSVPEFRNYNYGEILIRNTVSIEGADGYEIYASATKKGKYTKIGETNTEGIMNYNPGYNKGFYYSIRAYKVVNGVRIYSAYSPVKGYTMNLKVLTSLPVKFPLIQDSKSYVTFKSVSISKTKTENYYVTYKIKLNISKSYMRKNTKVSGKLYFYDYLKNELGYISYSFSHAKGTKKNWSKTINVRVPKNVVFVSF